MEDKELVCVLSVGAKFVYVIHEFDTLSVELRHIQVKGFTKFGDSEEVFDVFIRNNISLHRTYPSFMIIRSSRYPFTYSSNVCYAYNNIKAIDCKSLLYSL